MMGTRDVVVLLPSISWSGDGDEKLVGKIAGRRKLKGNFGGGFDKLRHKKSPTVEKLLVASIFSEVKLTYKTEIHV